MSYDEFNKNAWGREIMKNQMLYPDERLIAITARNFNDVIENRNRKALDIGFGSGRNLKLLLDYGFEVYGIDYSQDSINTAKKLFTDDVHRMKLELADLSDDIFENEFFDYIICYGVIFLREKEDVIQDLKRIYNLLKIGGKVAINFRTKDDHLFGKGVHISDNTYLLDSTSNEYENMLYTFFSLEEAEELVTDAGFTIENRERLDYWKNDMKHRNSWHIFTLRR